MTNAALASPAVVAWWRGGFDAHRSLRSAIDRTGTLHADRPAVIDTDGSWTTHGQIHERASRVAAWLAAEPSPVASLTRTSAALPVAVAAGVRAGVGFAVLDATIPAERLRAAMGEIAARRVLADSATLSLARELAGDPSRVLDVDDVATGTGLASPSDAYGCDERFFIFTSGSTGRPKGVIRSHASLHHATYNISRRFGYEPDDVMLYVGSPGHVGTLNDVLCGLATGHATVPVGFQGLDVGGLREAITRHGVTILSLSPSLLRLLLREFAERGVPPRLRLVIPSGEALLRSDVALFFRTLGPGVELAQSYGSTETGHMCAGWYHAADGEGMGPLTLTTPAEGVTIEILDESTGQPVPVGGSGVVRVRSAYLADGYTAAAPPEAKGRFGEDERGRFYVTGDRARRVDDAGFVVEGRGDRQVKIHGRRLELGDVDSSILRSDGWAEACSVYFPSLGAGGVLAAAVSPAKGADADLDGLRRALTQRLEAFAIPRRFLVLPALPKTPTGKTDVPEVARLLEASIAQGAAPAGDDEPPAGMTENWIADAWQYVLCSPQRPTRNVPFDVFGGDSLAAVALGLELAARFGGSFSIDFVSANATIRAQAEAIDAMAKDPGSRSLPTTRVVRLHPSNDGPYCLLVPGIGGHAWVFLGLMRRVASRCAVSSLHLSAPTPAAARSLDADTLARHAAHAYAGPRRERPLVLMGYSFGCVIAVEVARRLIASGHPVARLLLIDPAVSGAMTRLVRRRAGAALRTAWALADRVRGRRTAEPSRRLDEEVTLTARALRRLYSPRRVSIAGLACDVGLSAEYFAKTGPGTVVLGVRRDALPLTVFEGLSHLDVMRERGASRVAAWVDERLASIDG